MTSLFRIKILKIDKFVDFSCYIDYSSRTDAFRVVITLLFTNATPGAHKVSASRSAEASEARLCEVKMRTGTSQNKFSEYLP